MRSVTSRAAGERILPRIKARPAIKPTETRITAVIFRFRSISPGRESRSMLSGHQHRREHAYAKSKTEGGIRMVAQQFIRSQSAGDRLLFDPLTTGFEPLKAGSNFRGRPVS